MSTPIKNEVLMSTSPKSPFRPYMKESQQKIEEEVIIIDALKEKLYYDCSQRPDSPDPIARIKREGESRGKLTLTKALNERKIICDLGAENNRSIANIRRLNRMRAEEKRLECTIKGFDSPSIKKERVSYLPTKVGNKK